MKPTVVEEIFWTESAKITFQKIIDWLEEEWSEKEINKFIQRTEEMLSVLKRYPEMCRSSTKRKNVRIGILDKHTQLVYHYKPGKKQIEILLFWSMKQNPAKFKY
jgi:plasmid stabilization system protein ParE